MASVTFEAADEKFKLLALKLWIYLLFEKVIKANSLAFKKATKLRWWFPGGIIPGIRIQVHAMFAPFWTSCLAPIAMSRAQMENPMAIKL